MKMFPVLMDGMERQLHPNCPRLIPWELLAPYEDRARRNHGDQSLERLAERGGLDPGEMYWIWNDLRWNSCKIPTEQAVAFLIQRVQGAAQK